MNSLTSPLLTDLYQLNMIQAYLDHGETKTAVFEFFVRKFPPRRGFLIAAGLQQVLNFLETLRFSSEEIAWLARTRRFDKGLLERRRSTETRKRLSLNPCGQNISLRLLSCPRLLRRRSCKVVWLRPRKPLYALHTSSENGRPGCCYPCKWHRSNSDSVSSD